MGQNCEETSFQAFFAVSELRRRGSLCFVRTTAI
jgi:hypothetical protein